MPDGYGNHDAIVVIITSTTPLMALRQPCVRRADSKKRQLLHHPTLQLRLSKRQLVQGSPRWAGDKLTRGGTTMQADVDERQSWMSQSLPTARQIENNMLCADFHDAASTCQTAQKRDYRRAPNALTIAKRAWKPFSSAKQSGCRNAGICIAHSLHLIQPTPDSLGPSAGHRFGISSPCRLVCARPIADRRSFKQRSDAAASPKANLRNHGAMTEAHTSGLRFAQCSSSCSFTWLCSSVSATGSC